MEPRIDKPLLYVATTKDIWDTTQTLYSKRHIVSRFCTVETGPRIQTGTMNVMSYFNKTLLFGRKWIYAGNLFGIVLVMIYNT